MIGSQRQNSKFHINNDTFQYLLNIGSRVLVEIWTFLGRLCFIGVNFAGNGAGANTCSNLRTSAMAAVLETAVKFR